MRFFSLLDAGRTASGVKKFQVANKPPSEGLFIFHLYQYLESGEEQPKRLCRKKRFGARLALGFACLRGG